MPALPSWYNTRAGVRFLAPSEEQSVTQAISTADPASLDTRWLGIVVLKGPYGWAWRTLGASPTVDDEIIARASGIEPWAIYRAPWSIEGRVQAAEERERKAAEEAQEVVRQMARREREELRQAAEETKLRILTLSAGAFVGAAAVWLFLRRKP